MRNKNLTILLNMVSRHAVEVLNDLVVERR